MWNGKLKNEWIVFALILREAIAVGANKTKFFLVLFLRYLISDDFPVPALPVINIFLEDFSKRDIISLKWSFRTNLLAIMINELLLEVTS